MCSDYVFPYPSDAVVTSNSCLIQVFDQLYLSLNEQLNIINMGIILRFSLKCERTDDSFSVCSAREKNILIGDHY